MSVKFTMCQCELNGLARPTNGPIRIKETEVVSRDVMVAKLSGPVNGKVATVKEGNRYYFVGTDKKPREVPADSLTDALHASVFMLNESERLSKKNLSHKKRPMPHIDAGQKPASAKKVAKKKSAK